MEALFRDVDGLLEKAKSQEQIAVLDNLIQRLEDVQAKVENDPNMLPFLMPALTDAIKHTESTLTEKQKEWHSQINKLGKNIEKKFTTDLSNVIPTTPDGNMPDVFHALNSEASSMADSRLILYKIVADHLVREGYTDLAENFANETDVAFPAEMQEIFQDMHQIVQAMENDNMDPALSWAESNRSYLQRRKSPLEFQLHRFNYLRLLLSDTVSLPVNLSKLASTFPISNDTNYSRQAQTNGDTSRNEIESRKGPHLALVYGRKHFKRFYETHSSDISRLITAALFMPIEKLLSSPYANVFDHQGKPSSSLNLSSPPSTETDMAVDVDSTSNLNDNNENSNGNENNDDVDMLKTDSDVLDSARQSAARDTDDGERTNPPVPVHDIKSIHADHLIPLFMSDYCALKKAPKVPPLKVVTDIGGGGALAKIAKVRSVMKQNRNEWSSNEELPVEIPLPNEYKFHSLFICPVSKGQSTDTNPPMMMPCGHVITNESLMTHSKGNTSTHIMNRSVKCPYCPAINTPSSAMRVYF